MEVSTHAGSVGTEEGGGYTKEWRQIVIVFPSWEAEKGNGSCLKIHQRSFGMDLGSEPL